jgi:hypothetical protein
MNSQESCSEDRISTDEPGNQVAPVNPTGPACDAPIVSTLDRSRAKIDAFQLPRLPPLPHGASPDERRRYRRDLLIYLAYRQGLTQQFLADAFEVSKSFVRDVTARLKAYDDYPEETASFRARPWSPVEAALPRNGSPRKHGRTRRDWLIRRLHHHKFSQRFLACAFDLPRSRIGSIIETECADHSPARD